MNSHGTETSEYEEEGTPIPCIFCKTPSGFIQNIPCCPKCYEEFKKNPPKCDLCPEKLKTLMEAAYGTCPRCYAAEQADVAPPTDEELYARYYEPGLELPPVDSTPRTSPSKMPPEIKTDDGKIFDIPF